MFLTAHALALCYYLGPSRSASLALKCALVCAAGKFATTVFTASSEDVRSLSMQPFHVQNRAELLLHASTGEHAA